MSVQAGSLSACTLWATVDELRGDPALRPLLADLAPDDQVAVRVDPTAGVVDLTMGELTTRWSLAALLRGTEHADNSRGFNSSTAAGGR